MTEVRVENLVFSFDSSVDPRQYEVGGACVAGWPQGARVVDVVAPARATHARVVLHLEPHPAAGAHAALFPSSIAANVLLKLRSLVADIDPNPQVLDIVRTPKAAVPWSVAAAP